jgi:Domain of unknown function (DUF5666)
MARHRFFSRLTLLSLSALALGTVACSKSSPTEPAFDDLSQPIAATSSLTAVTDESRGRGRGGDDRGGDDRRGRGNDDRNDDNRGRRGRGNDDRNDDNRGGRGRGNDNRPDDRPRAGIEFEAAVTAVNGQTLVLANGTRVIVNGQTQWSNRGDLFTLSQVAGSVASGDPVRAEGRGDRQADGAIVARTLKVEVDD